MFQFVSGIRFSVSNAVPKEAPDAMASIKNASKVVAKSETLATKNQAEFAFLVFADQEIKITERLKSVFRQPYATAHSLENALLRCLLETIPWEIKMIKGQAWDCMFTSCSYLSDHLILEKIGFCVLFKSDMLEDSDESVLMSAWNQDPLEIFIADTICRQSNLSGFNGFGVLRLFV